MKNDIVVLIVLYNDLPQDYIQKFRDVMFIIVDNTPSRNLELNLPNIFYIPLFKNYGIAKALNVGFKKAKEMRAQWVLTMDQDSHIPKNMLDQYKKCIGSNNTKVGMVTPLINMYKGENKKTKDTVSEIHIALSSGSLINMDAYDAAGGFLEKLFIDEVDFEFCWHIRSLGYHIYQLNNVVMQHQLGDTKEYKLFGRHLFYVMNEKPIRHYYMQRNQLYIRNQYANIYPEIKPTFWGAFMCLVKIVLFEKNVLKKLKARYLGYRDYKNNIFGECKYKELL